MTYTPTEWSSAADKMKFELQFKRFTERGFKRRDFPKWFYTRLSTMFGHIAHYDQRGFYEEFFTTPEDRRRFVDQALRWPCYGDPTCTYSDVERVLQQWLKSLVESYDDQGSQDAHP